MDMTVGPLVLVFKYTQDEVKKDNTMVLAEYTGLLRILRDGGLAAVGKQTRNAGEVLVCISFLDENKASEILIWEMSMGRPSATKGPLDNLNRSASSQLHALYSYVSSPVSRGGLGVTPGTIWPHVQTFVPPRPVAYKNAWLQKLKSTSPILVYNDDEIDLMAGQYGESAAFYFAFLSEYTRALVLPSVIGGALWFQADAFVRPWYSLFVLAWAIVFIEQWRTKHQRLCIRWNHSTERVPLYLAAPPVPWWITEAKAALSIPWVFFAIIFVGFNMSVAFVLEAFISRLYDGPTLYKIAVGLIPTVYNALTTPPFVALHQTISGRLTSWENHASQSTHEAYLILKVVPVVAMVAFYALILSAGIYVPFGNELMHFFHIFYHRHSSGVVGNASVPQTTPYTRLQEQLFSFTFVLQLLPLLVELVIPPALRWFRKTSSSVWTPSTSAFSSDGKGEQEAREFLARISDEATLPEHSFFDDYLTLTMQFGYCVMWSSCWPLTPAMTLLLAAIRLRTDAFKILINFKYPISSRAASESSRIWISTQSVIIWAGAITNVAMVAIVDPYLRIPPSHRPQIDIPALVMQIQAQPSVLLELSTWSPAQGGPSSSTGSLISVQGFFVMLLASYGVIVFKRYVQHILHSTEGVEHSGSPAGSTLNTKNRDLKLAVAPALSKAFWGEDEGEADISKKRL